MAITRPTFATVVVIAISIGTYVVAQTEDIGGPPGRVIDIGGRRLHLHCTGSGSPTVVIEAGASSFGIDFALVQPGSSKTTRTCSYDRAGMGWSDPRADVDTPIRIIRDLRKLLDVAGEKGPYVMVGASRGGVYVRLFQAEYPVDVAGLVLIDPTAEDQLFTMFERKAVALTSLTHEQFRSLQPPPSATIPIPTRQPQTGPPFDALPPALYATRVALDRRLIASRPPSVSGEVVIESALADHEMLTRLSAARNGTKTLLGDMPLIVLSRGRGLAAAQQEAHADIARMSTNSRHEVVADAYHEIHLSHSHVVIGAITDAVNAVRTKQRLAAR